MNQEKAIELLEKFANKSLNREEEGLLQDWIESAGSKDVTAVMERYEGIVMNTATNEADPLLFQRIKEKIAASEENDKVRKLFPWTRVAAAAVIILMLGLGSYFLLNKQPKQIARTESGERKQDVAPGGNKATLILANGTRIILDSAAKGNLAKQGNTKVIKLDSGQLAYNSMGLNDEILYNTISTPRGGQYEVVLADGSKVWLNAASSLKYPASFSGKERNVELTGEGYFEVAKNPAMPFHVTVNNIRVEVLGTHFDINSYSDEANISTTLLEGKVKVSTIGEAQTGQPAVILQPGQQTQYSNGTLTAPREVNTGEVTGWKDGFFHFESADLKTILRQFSRWYDVDVVYEGNIKNRKFFGIVKRSSTLASVLEMLQDNNILFRIEGKKLVVKSG